MYGLWCFNVFLLCIPHSNLWRGPCHCLCFPQKVAWPIAGIKPRLPGLSALFSVGFTVLALPCSSQMAHVFSFSPLLHWNLPSPAILFLLRSSFSSPYWYLAIRLLGLHLVLHLELLCPPLSYQHTWYTHGIAYGRMCKRGTGPGSFLHYTLVYWLRVVFFLKSQTYIL